MTAKRIGLTMRVAQAEAYKEARDCLAQDWSEFMAAALPSVHWLPVPNLGQAVADYARDWELDGLILTGGNDLNESSLRDETERALLRYAIDENLPVFGVCRGLQLIQSFFGGDLQPCSRQEHVGVQHVVRVTANPGRWSPPLEIREVNSFHAWAVPLEGLAPDLRAFAATTDGWAEGVMHADSPITAVQWHPERMRPFASTDCDLVRELFEIAA
ncbi:MAG TPA: gamma-glutamyl-gamma-aminobutyrate hydrolase family protein [Verrucomicrobiae bacterium]|nr:gamma-glutamyl-gamma-aminobutyrate hydrolase family protein [Verrucomicrobiae bacterium]